MQWCVSQDAQLISYYFVAGIIGMEAVNRNQSLGARILSTVGAVKRLVDIGDWNAIGCGRGVDVVIHLVQIWLQSGKDSLLHVGSHIGIVDIHGPNDGVVGGPQLQQLGNDGTPVCSNVVTAVWRQSSLSVPPQVPWV